MGDTLLDRERAEEALPLLQRAVTRDPKSLAAHKSLARAELAAGKPVQAIPHLKLALPTDEDGTLHYQLAQAYRASGQTELAKKALQEYQQIQSSAAAARESASRNRNHATLSSERPLDRSYLDDWDNRGSRVPG